MPPRNRKLNINNKVENKVCQLLASDIDKMLTDLEQFKQLTKFLLNKIFFDNEEDQLPEFVEQVILRHLKSLGYVNYNNDLEEFQLTYKGICLLSNIED